jgi:hypothetical protein
MTLGALAAKDVARLLAGVVGLDPPECNDADDDIADPGLERG